MMSFGAFVPVFVAALAVIGLALAVMAIGVMFRRPCLRGSCGGPALETPGGERLSCATCPNRASSRTPGRRGRRRPGRKSRSMRTALVPIDTSGPALRALQYAMTVHEGIQIINVQPKADAPVC